MVRHSPVIFFAVLLQSPFFAASALAASKESQDSHDVPAEPAHLSCESAPESGVVGCTFEIPVPSEKEAGGAEDSEEGSPTVMTYCFPSSKGGAGAISSSPRRCVRLHVRADWAEPPDDEVVQDQSEPEVTAETDADEGVEVEPPDDEVIQDQSEPEVTAETDADEGAEADVAPTPASTSTCSSQSGECGVDNDAPPNPILPIRLDDYDGTIYAQARPSEKHISAYKVPFSVYTLEVEDALNSLKLELSKTPPSSARDPAAFAEYVLTLAELSVELGLAHVQMVMNVEEKLDREETAKDSIYTKDRLEEVKNAAQVELEYACAAFESALELFEMARSFGSTRETIGTEASVRLHLAEMAMNRRLPLDDRVDFVSALRHSRLAKKLYRAELDKMGDDGIHSGNDKDGDDLIVLELGLADTSLRVGTVLLDMFEHGMLDMAMNIDGSSISTTTASSTSTERTFNTDEESVLLEARGEFETGVSFYRRSLQSLEKSIQTNAPLTAEEREDMASLADALHNVGVVSSYLSDLPRVVDAYEESYSIYAALSKQTIEILKDELEYYAQIMAETMQSLSDAYLQSGRYEEATERFRRAADIYSDLGTLGIDRTGIKTHPRRLQTAFDSDEAIELHKEALEQYRQSLIGDLPPEFANDLGGDDYLEPDDLYEADLLATLGSIHLSREEANEAHEYLSSAVDLYEESLEGDDPALADALLNLAFAELHLENYEEGARAYERAVEIYRETVGEGNNPFTFGDDGSATAGLGGSNMRQKTAGDNDGIQKRFIDVDAYQLGIKNATGKVGEL